MRDLERVLLAGPWLNRAAALLAAYCVARAALVCAAIGASVCCVSSTLGTDGPVCTLGAGDLFGNTLGTDGLVCTLGDCRLSSLLAFRVVASLFASSLRALKR